MSVIVLTANYQYWTQVSVHKAIKWYILNKIQIVESHSEHKFGSIELKINTPLIVRLLKFTGYKPKQQQPMHQF